MILIPEVVQRKERNGVHNEKNKAVKETFHDVAASMCEERVL
jgi:hypothetical protein